MGNGESWAPATGDGCSHSRGKAARPKNHRWGQASVLANPSQRIIRRGKPLCLPTHAKKKQGTPVKSSPPMSSQISSRYPDPMPILVTWLSQFNRSSFGFFNCILAFRAAKTPGVCVKLVSNLCKASVNSQLKRFQSPPTSDPTPRAPAGTAPTSAFPPSGGTTPAGRCDRVLPPSKPGSDRKIG